MNKFRKEHFFLQQQHCVVLRLKAWKKGLVRERRLFHNDLFMNKLKKLLICSASRSHNLVCVSGQLLLKKNHKKTKMHLLPVEKMETSYMRQSDVIDCK